MKVLKDRQTRTFFTGTEVEHTPAKGAKTLFVIGTPSIEEIDAEIERLGNENFIIEQIYFGTSQSCNDIDYIIWNRFDRLISHYLQNTSIWVTLDFDISNIDRVRDAEWASHLAFIPMISAKIPNIEKLNTNACLKIDSLAWGHSNGGVWTHKLSTLQDETCYTPWEEYEGDE